MSGSIRLTGPTGAMGIGLTNVRRTTGAYVDLDFAKSYYELGGRVRKSVSDFSGWSFTRASTATYFGSNGLLQTASSGTPRFAYDPVTLASLGILVEEARTNVCLQSADFATSWSVVAGMSVTANATTDPAGTSLADKIVSKTASSSQAVYQAIVTSAVAYTVSVFAKPAGYNWIGLGFGSGTTVDGAFFNVSTGAIGTVAASSTAKITALPNGWYRCEVTRTLSAGTNYVQAEIHNADNQGNWAANGTDGLYLWQAQLEAGTGASSPIPTTTASVTRAADVPNLTFNMPLTSTWVVEFQCAYINGARQTLAGITDSGNSRFMIRGPDAGGAPVVAIGNGSAVTSITGSTVVTANVATKLAVLADSLSTNADIVMNGGSAVTGAVQLASATTGAQTMAIGSNQVGALQLGGTIARLRIFATGLPVAKQQSLTS